MLARHPSRWKEVLLAIVVLIAGKVAVMMACGPMFGLSQLASTRAGLLLAPGGEFAFVAFGESVARGVLPAALTNQLYLVSHHMPYSRCVHLPY
jgi:Kef-type K+ transport system membrane component KefB